MKKIVGIAFGIACLAAALNAHATTGTELIVKGTIKPAACKISMMSGGIIDYGDIASGQLKPTEFNPLGEKITPLSVSCGTHAVKFGLRFTDMQAASKVTGILNALGAGYSEAHNYGLGSVSGKKTGGYAVILKDLKASATPLYPIVRVSNGAWQKSDGKVAQVPNQYSWSTSSSYAVPAAVSQLSGNIVVSAVINKGNDLGLSSEVTLNGRATLELSYI